MAAQLARWFGEWNGPSLTVRNVDSRKQPIGVEYSVYDHELSNAETFKAAAAYGLNPKAYATKDLRLAAIRMARQNGVTWSPINARVLDGTQSTATIQSDGRITVQNAYDHAATEPKADPISEKMADEANRNHPDYVRLERRVTAVESGLEIASDMVLKVDDIAKQVAEMAPTVIRVTLPTAQVIDHDQTEHYLFPEVLRLVSLREHVWLVGPAGSGKSTLAQHVAQVLALPFYALSCHAQMTASQVFGYPNAQGVYVRTLFREAYEHGGVFLFDEIDAASSNVLAALNGSLAQDVCAFPDGMVTKHCDFVAMGGANTFGLGATAEYSGRAKIDAATIDRFQFEEMDYDRALERSMVLGYLSEPEASSWITEYERFRSNAQSHSLKIILGTRGLVGGAKLLAAGFSHERVLALRVFRGVSADMVAKVVGR